MRDKKLLTYRSISHAIFSIVSPIENLTSVLVIFNFIQNKTCYYNIITKPLTDLETSYAAFDIPANWLSKSVGMIEFSTGIIALYLMRFNNSEFIETQYFAYSFAYLFGGTFAWYYLFFNIFLEFWSLELLGVQEFYSLQDIETHLPISKNENEREEIIHPQCLLAPFV